MNAKDKSFEWNFVASDVIGAAVGRNDVDGVIKLSQISSSPRDFEIHYVRFLSALFDVI